MEPVGFLIMQTNHSDLGKFAAFDGLGLYFPVHAENIKIFETETQAIEIKDFYLKNYNPDIILKIVPLFAKISD